MLHVSSLQQVSPAKHPLPQVIADDLDEDD